MKHIVLALALAVIATPSLARAESGCDAKAAEKKLAGAAKASFLKKCEKDAAEAGCQNQALMKKLSGAAKSSFLTKCVRDAQAKP